MKNKAIFLDKDGTLLHNVPYNIDPHLMVLEPNLSRGLKMLQAKGFLMVVVTNQAGVALGYFGEDGLAAVGEELVRLFRNEGLVLSGYYYCPHYPEGNVPAYSYSCYCRKPQPGMLLRAASDLDIDLSQSWMIGDILNDVEAGNRAGCRTVLINNGHETDWEVEDERVPDLIVSNINEAAELIEIADEILLLKNTEINIDFS